MLTKVKFEDGDIKNIDITTMDFIPNHSYDKLVKLIAKPGEQKVEMISNSAYHTQRDYVNKTKTKEFKYPLISRVRVGLDFDEYWSSTNQNGHFDIPKLVFSLEGAATGVYLDIDGTYGLTQFSWAIVDDVENLTQMKKVFDSSVFRELMTATTLKGDVFNYKIIATFRKEFWKDFL
jgi:hypothetical protein